MTSLERQAIEHRNKMDKMRLEEIREETRSLDFRIKELKVEKLILMDRLREDLRCR